MALTNNEWVSTSHLFSLPSVDAIGRNSRSERNSYGGGVRAVRRRFRSALTKRGSDEFPWKRLILFAMNKNNTFNTFTKSGFAWRQAHLARRTSSGGMDFGIHLRRPDQKEKILLLVSKSERMIESETTRPPRQPTVAGRRRFPDIAACPMHRRLFPAKGCGSS